MKYIKALLAKLLTPAPRGFEETYLGRSVDHHDLERRLRALERRHLEGSCVGR